MTDTKAPTRGMSTTARYLGFKARALMGLWEPFEKREKLVQEGERLLAELAADAVAVHLVHVLFSYGYDFSFDVPGKSAAGIERLRGRLPESENPAALELRIYQLEDLRGAWIEGVRRALERLPYEPENATARAYFAAQLGDAAAALSGLGHSPFADQSPLNEWLTEARSRKAEG